jgi:hypothetical protein
MLLERPSLRSESPNCSIVQLVRNISKIKKYIETIEFTLKNE